MLNALFTGLGALTAGLVTLWFADRVVPPDWPLRDLVAVAAAVGAFMFVGGMY